MVVNPFRSISKRLSVPRRPLSRSVWIGHLRPKRGNFKCLESLGAVQVEQGFSLDVLRTVDDGGSS